MTFSNGFWLLVFVLIYALYINFINKGRKKGYGALALRTSELRNQGVANVWLLYGNKGVGFQRIRPEDTSVWTQLNTGFLAYTTNQNFVIEFPWWGKMRQLCIVPFSQLSILETSIVFNRNRHSAVRIGHQSYVVAGVNIDEAEAVKQQLKLQDTNLTNELKNKFITSALESPDNDLNEMSILQSESNKEAKMLPLSGVIKGVILYVLLPGLIITAVLIVWAVISKQPAFR